MASLSPAPYPLYDTSFYLHRVSPLFTGNEYLLGTSILGYHARKLRDVLAGDILRGVRINAEGEDSTLAYTGSLETVTWRHLPYEEDWTGYDEAETITEDDTTVMIKESRGMIVKVTYELREYKAILLRGSQGKGLDDSGTAIRQNESGFEHFPLMFTKMPLQLRDAFVRFLETTFDARISDLQLPPQWILTSFDQYLAYICVDDEGSLLDASGSAKVVRQVIGGTDMVISTGTSGQLAKIDIKLRAKDVPKLILRGKELGKNRNTPFIDAITLWFQTHMAMNIRHPKLKITRIACDAFLIGAEGRILLKPPPGDDEESPQRRATKRLINGLVDFAK